MSSGPIIQDGSQSLPEITGSQSDIPTEDYFYGLNLKSQGDLDELVDRLENDLQKGYFMQWEAVERQERGLELTPEQNEKLEDLFVKTAICRHFNPCTDR